MGKDSEWAQSDQIVNFYFDLAKRTKKYSREQERIATTRLIDQYRELSKSIVDYVVFENEDSFGNNRKKENDLEVHLGLRYLGKEFEMRGHFYELERKIVNEKEKVKNSQNGNSNNLENLAVEAYNLIPKSGCSRSKIIGISRQLLEYGVNASDDSVNEQNIKIKRRINTIERIENGLTNANIYLIISIARRYSGKSMQLSDLIQEGIIGFMRGLEHYDPSLGYRVSTYTGWWIRQNIVRELVNQDKTIRLPVHVDTDLNKLRDSGRMLTTRLERGPNLFELSEDTGLSKEILKKLMELNARQDKSLSDTLGQTENLTLEETIPSSIPGQDQIIMDKDMKKYFVRILKQLQPIEAGVLEERFGLNGKVPQTLQEVGNMYGVCRERIRQIQERALRKVRIKIIKDKTFPLPEGQLTF